MWILALALFSTEGYYVQSFDSEIHCVAAMDKLIDSSKDMDNVKSISCVPDTVQIGG